MAEASSNDNTSSRQRRAQQVQQAQQAQIQQAQQAQQSQQATATPLHLHIRRDSRPSESVDIERLLSSSFYPGSNYNFSDPVRAGSPRLQSTAANNLAQSPSNSTDTVFINDDNDDSPERRAMDVESPESDETAINKQKGPAQGKAAGTKRKPDTRDNEKPGEVRNAVHRLGVSL